MTINLGWPTTPPAPTLVAEVEALADERRAEEARARAERDAVRAEAVGRYERLALGLARGRAPKVAAAEVAALLVEVGLTDADLRADVERARALVERAGGEALEAARSVVEARRAELAWVEAVERKAIVVREIEAAEARALAERNATERKREELRGAAIDRALLPAAARERAHAALVAWEAAATRLRLRVELEGDPRQLHPLARVRSLLGDQGAAALAAEPLEDVRAAEARAAQAYLDAQREALAHAGEVGLWTWLAEERAR